MVLGVQQQAVHLNGRRGLRLGLEDVGPMGVEGPAEDRAACRSLNHELSVALPLLEKV